MNHEYATLLQKGRLVAKAHQKLIARQSWQLELFPQRSAQSFAGTHRYILEGKMSFGIGRHEQGPANTRRSFVKQDVELLDQLFRNALNASGRGR